MESNAALARSPTSPQNRICRLRAEQLRLSAAQHFVGYDPEGYSMWACDFKYNDENTVR